MVYFRSDDQFIYLEAPEAEFYIPMYYFEGSAGFATDSGSVVKSLGVFDVGFFENGSLKEMRVLNLPTWIDFNVIDFEVREVSLPGDENPTNCKVLKYLKGQKIMNNSVVQDSSNAEAFIKFVTKGKIPSIVPYEKSIQIWKKNQAMNNANLGVSPVIEEDILSVAYRYKKNPGIKFSHVIGKDPSISQYDYVMNNIRQICQYTSTFTALTFEDIDSMVTTSLNRTRNHGVEASSPLEALFKL